MATGFKVMVWHGSKLVAVHFLAPPGHVRIQALNGWRYQLVDVETGVAPKNVLMTRKGKSLIVDFMHGSGQEDTVELAGFFDVEVIDAGIVAAAPDGSLVAYEAHPSYGVDDQLRLTEGQSTMWSVGDRVVAKAVTASSTADDVDWAPVVLAAVALGAAAGGGGAVTSPTTAPAQLVVQGVVAAGPVVAGHGLILRVFGAHGAELGSAAIAADGTYAVTIDPNHTGAVLVKVYDIDDGADYFDEGTRSTKDLATDLRAMLWVDKPGTYVVNVNPLTELAVQKLGLGAGDRGGSANTPDTAWDVADAAQAIRSAKNAVEQAFGLTGVDLVSGPVNLVVDRDGRDNAQANAYGRALAAIAGMEVPKGVATQTVTSLIAQAMQTDDAWAALKLELVAGAHAAQVDADLFARQIGAVRSDAAAVLQEAWNTVYAMSRDGGAAAESLPNERLAALGVSVSLSSAQSALLSSVINQLSRAAVDSVAELDGLVRAVHAVSSASSGGALRVQDVRLLGVEVSDPDHLGLVQVLLRERFPSGQFALSDLTRLIDIAGNVGQLGVDLGNLSPAAAAAITPAQLATVSNVGQLGANLGYLSPPTISAITTTQLATIGNLGDLGANLINLSPSALSSISSTGATTLTVGQLAAFDVNHIRALQPVAVAALPPAVLASLTTTQLGAMTTDQLGALTVGQVAAMRPAQLSALDAVQVAALTAQQISALTPVQVAALVHQPTHLPTLSNVTVGQSTVAGSAGDSEGETIILTITFDRLVNGFASGNNSTVLSLGGLAVAATWGGVDGSNTRTLTYTVQAGQNGQAAIDEAALKAALIAGITDVAGNGFIYTDNGGSIPNIDATPLPVIDTTAPVDQPNTVLTADSGGGGDSSTNSGAITPPTNTEVGAVVEYRWRLGSGAFSDWSANYIPPATDGSADGDYTVEVRQRDAAGNLSPVQTIGYTLDTALPTVTITDNVAGSLTDEPVTFTFEFSKAITGFTADDVTVSANGTKGAFTAVSERVYTLVVEPQANTSGTLSVSVPADVATDVAGNTNAASATATQAFNTMGPSVDIALADSVLRAGQSTVVTFSFNKVPTGFASEDIEVDNGTLGPLSSSNGGLTWSATFTPNATTESATNSIRVLAGSYTDARGNSGAAGNSPNYTVDTTAPAAPTLAEQGSTDLSDSLMNDTEATSTTFRATLPSSGSLAVAGDRVELLLGGSAFGTAKVVTLTGTDISNGYVDFTVLKADLGADGAKSLSAAITDVAGNVGTASNAPDFTLDTAVPAAPTLAEQGSTDLSDSLMNDTEATSTTFRATLPSSGSLAVAGDRVELLLGGSAFGTAKVVTLTGTDISNGYVDFTVLKADLGADGAKSLSAAITDVAGNVGTASNPLAFTLDTAAPTSTLSSGSAANTGSATVQSSEVGTAYLVKTGGTNAVVVTDLASITSAADAKWNQVAIATANTNANLSLAGLEEGTYSLYTLDQAGNLSAASGSTFTVITSLVGQAVISMDNWGGQLIAPVQVEGKWYYVWDRNGNGSHGTGDLITMDSLEQMFFGNSTGTVMTSTNRTMTLGNGVTIMLPTIGDGMTNTEINKNGTAVSSPTQTNATYDDLLAIWDAHNGNSAGTGMNGVPAGWIIDDYWSATPSASGHAVIGLYDGYVYDNFDVGNAYVAFQVL